MKLAQALDQNSATRASDETSGPIVFAPRQTQGG